MRLADFIENRLPDILEEWEDFAATLLPAAAGMASLALRDHAEDILRAVAADMRTVQSAEQQRAKSRGLRDAASGTNPATAAQVHGALRASSGFSSLQLVSEYRAMRASVLHLYAEAGAPGHYTVADIGRFNEALDQAIAESVRIFTDQVENWRNLFLAVLQHDLRGPLQALLSTSYLIAALPPCPQREQATVRLKRSGERMKMLLDELLDYNRATLNLGLAMKREACDLVTSCREEVELRRMAHPGHAIEWAASGDTAGMWDASRVQQALGNLISNAAKHGAPGGRIGVELRGDSDEVELVVSNDGPPISPDAIASIFDPLRRARGSTSDDRSHLGLGLFIVREIAQAHGGEVEVESTDTTTRFCMRMRRSTAHP